MAIPFATFKADYSPQGVLAGILQGQQREQAAEGQDINMAMARQKMAMAPEQERAKLAYQQAMTSAIPSEIELRKAQIHKALHPTDDITKNPLELMSYGEQLFRNNPNDPRVHVVADMIHKLTTGKQGISVTTSPTGGSTVSIGGQQQQQSPGYYGDTVVNPNIKGSRGGGATFTDVNTGKVYSSPTRSYKSTTQQRIVADKQLENNVNALGDWLKSSDYFNPASHAAAFAAYGLKGIFPGLAKKASGLRLAQGGITDAADKFFQQSGVPKTKEAFNQVYNILKPTMNETSDTWSQRVKQQLDVIKQNNLENQKALRQGVSIGSNTQPYKFVRHAPRSFADVMYPKFDHVINPDYKPVSEQKPTQQSISPMNAWLAKAKSLPGNKNYTDAQLISYYKNKKGIK